MITKNGNNNTKIQKIMHKVTIIRNVFIIRYYDITIFGNNNMMIGLAQNNKKELKKVDVEITERILVVMYETGGGKKTVIARRANMSYDNCLMYLEYFKTMLFVEQQTDIDGSEIFVLTPYGISVCKAILSKQYELKQVEQKKN